MRQPPPNIIYLHAHDVGRYIQPYGYAVETPNLQKLAEEGLLFRNAFCANPTCSPSRACLLTGQYAHSNGMLGLAHRGFRLNDYGHHLANQLRPAGYTSALAGTQHIAAPPFASIQDIGYDKILTEEDGFEQPTAAAEDYLKNAPDKPFFLSVGYFAPHRTDDGKFPSLYPTPSSNYLRPPTLLPDTPETREDFANYAASIRSTDTCMGRVLDTLEATGLAENTLVIATTDHGIAFPSMKCSLTDHGTGVMLIMRGPNGFTGGKLIDSMVSQVDIAPTLMEIAGLPIPEHMQGVSLVPILGGESPERDCVFSETNFHAAEEPARSARTKKWKYIRRYSHYPKVVLPNCDDGPSKDFLIQNDWENQPYEEEMLFDLIFDPNESHNLINDPNHQKALFEMRTRLDRWMKETQDPLLSGPLKRPTDAIITDHRERSPKGNKLNCKPCI